MERNQNGQPIFAQGGTEETCVIRYVADHPNVKLPTRSYPGDAGFDIYLPEDVYVEPHSFLDVQTGMRVELSLGYWIRITGRSSTIRKHGILVAEGVIDNGYRGPMAIGLFNLSGIGRCLRAGERVAQIIPYRLVDVEWELVRELTSSERGENGYGSSGR